MMYLSAKISFLAMAGALCFASVEACGGSTGANVAPEGDRQAKGPQSGNASAASASPSPPPPSAPSDGRDDGHDDSEKYLAPPKAGTGGPSRSMGSGFGEARDLVGSARLMRRSSGAVTSSNVPDEIKSPEFLQDDLNTGGPPVQRKSSGGKTGSGFGEAGDLAGGVRMRRRSGGATSSNVPDELTTARKTTRGKSPRKDLSARKSPIKHNEKSLITHNGRRAPKSPVNDEVRRTSQSVVSARTQAVHKFSVIDPLKMEAIGDRL